MVVNESSLDVLSIHPEISRLSGDGHTDNRGGASLNRKLSADRAESVKRWLTLHGVDEGRVESHGYGADHPLIGNDSEEGRRWNRRVEFRVVDASKADRGALR